MVGVLVMVVACLYLLAFGLIVLFGAPLRSGQGFWRLEKFFYGVIPVGAAVAILSVSLRRLAGSYRRRRNAWLAAFAVVLVASVVDEALFRSIRDRMDQQGQVVWHKESGRFSWGKGEIRVPPGFSHVRLMGIDTLMGRFTAEDGTRVIEYDIGDLAGEHGAMGLSETLTDGSRVRRVRATYVDEKGNPTLLQGVVPR